MTVTVPWPPWHGRQRLIQVFYTRRPTLCRVRCLHDRHLQCCMHESNNYKGLHRYIMHVSPCVQLIRDRESCVLCLPVHHCMSDSLEISQQQLNY